MNRLILIGNGFDLAHGLKTGYNHFIEHLWKQIFESFFNALEKANYGTETKYEDDVKLINFTFRSYGSDGRGNFFMDDPTKSSSDNRISKGDYKDSLDKIIELFTTNLKCKYTNEFFGIITEGYKNKKWSGVEADYYRELKKVKGDEGKVEKLNNEFNLIKELLKEYLKKQKEFEPNKETYKLIYSPIPLKDIRLANWDLYLDEIYNRLTRQYDR